MSRSRCRDGGIVLGDAIVQIVLMIALYVCQRVVAATERDDAAGADAARGGCGASAAAVHHTGHRRDAAARCLWRGCDGRQLGIRLGATHIQPGHALRLAAIQGSRAADDAAVARAANVDTGAGVVGRIAAQSLLGIGAWQCRHAAGYLFVDGRGLDASRQAQLLGEGLLAAAGLIVAAHRSDLDKRMEIREREEDELGDLWQLINEFKNLTGHNSHEMPA